MKPTCYLAINGIHSDPGAADGWTDRFVDWMHTQRGAGIYVAEKFEYYTNFALRWFRQRARANAIAATVNARRRAGYRVVLVGHSNGCDLIGKVLTDTGADVDACHLFAPATDEECFIDAMARGTVRRIHTYGSRNDSALKLAGFSKLALGWAQLGYGSMGLRCHEFAAQFPGVVFDHSNDKFGHSTWFEGPRFDATMRLLAANDLADQKSFTNP